MPPSCSKFHRHTGPATYQWPSQPSKNTVAAPQNHQCSVTSAAVTHRQHLQATLNQAHIKGRLLLRCILIQLAGRQVLDHWHSQCGCPCHKVLHACSADAWQLRWLVGGSDVLLGGVTCSLQGSCISSSAGGACACGGPGGGGRGMHSVSQRDM